MILLRTFGMLFILVCVAALCQDGRARGRSAAHHVLSKSSTDVLKGFAIVAIIFSHISAERPLIGYESEFAHILSVLSLWGGSFGVGIFFVLSGYGNWFSIQSGRHLNSIEWLLRKTVRLLAGYIVSLFLVYTLYFLTSNSGIGEVFFDFVNLRMPGTSTWYLKVQMLMYLFMAVSFRMSRCFQGRRISSPFLSIVTMSILVMVWIVGCQLWGLQDYWWMTSMCYPAGSFLACYGERLRSIIEKWKSLTFLVIASMFSIAYLCSHLLGADRPLLLVFAHMISASSFVMLFTGRDLRSKVLQIFGKGSYELYLVHIGLVALFFEEKIAAFDLAVALYLVNVCVLSSAAHMIASKAGQAINSALRL